MEPDEPGHEEPLLDDVVDGTITSVGVAAAGVERAISRRSTELANVDDTLQRVQDILDEL